MAPPPPPTPSELVKAHYFHYPPSAVRPPFHTAEHIQRLALKSQREEWFKRLAKFYASWPVGANWSWNRPGGVAVEFRKKINPTVKRKLRGSEPVGKRKTFASRSVQERQRCRRKNQNALARSCRFVARTGRSNIDVTVDANRGMKPISRQITASRMQRTDEESVTAALRCPNQRDDEKEGQDSGDAERSAEDVDSDWVDISDYEANNTLDIEDDYVVL